MLSSFAYGKPKETIEMTPKVDGTAALEARVMAMGVHGLPEIRELEAKLTATLAEVAAKLGLPPPR